MAKAETQKKIMKGICYAMALLAFQAALQAVDASRNNITMA